MVLIQRENELQSLFSGDESPEDLPWSTDEQSGGDELLTGMYSLRNFGIF